MREFFELVHEYPGTAMCLGLFTLFVIEEICGTIRKKR